MKKELMLGFIFVVFGFSLVAAASCSDSSQTIMKLYAPTNSHVSAWNESSSYTEEICYDDASLFGSTYSGADPHDCDGTNRILSLYSSSNSHASDVNAAPYEFDVCYGDLQCVYDSSAGVDCSNSGKIVARISSESNAHISTAADTNYPVKVCCVSVSGGDLYDGFYWTDMDGNVITEVDFGDSIQMIASDVGSGTFEIKDEDLLIDDDIRSIDGVSSGSDLIATWTITSEDLDAAVNVLDDEDYSSFYFEVDGEASGYLAVNPDGDDTPMTLDILSPNCGEHFNQSTAVTIEVSAFDDDDLITGNITINGDSTSFSNGGISFEHTFDTPGSFQILAEASNTRGYEMRVIHNIMVLEMEGEDYVDGEYIAACIDEPLDFTDIAGSIVDFNASSTRGARVESGVLDILIPDEGDMFSWYWTFYPQGIEVNFIDSVAEDAYIFTAEFPVAGENSASLRVEI